MHAHTHTQRLFEVETHTHTDTHTQTHTQFYRKYSFGCYRILNPTLPWLTLLLYLPAGRRSEIAGNRLFLHILFNFVKNTPDECN